MKRLCQVAVVIMAFLFCGQVYAGTYTAASCSYADVNGVINGPTHTAVNGDVINIPSGTCTWTSNLVLPSNVGLTLTGAGTPNSGSGTTGAASSCHATVIVDNAGSSTFLMAFSPQYGNSTTRLSCIDIEPQSAGTSLYAPIQVEGTCTSSGCPQFRIDNVVFGLTTQWTESGNGAQAGAMARLDNTFGVMDHNTIPSGSNVELFNAQLSAYLGVGAFGDNSWAQPDSLGGANNVFAENNVFYSSYLALNDCEAPGPMGCRVVDRYNTMTAQGSAAFGIFENHGTETGGRFRGGREAEVYNNTLNCTVSCSSADGGLRSGTGMFFGNHIVFTGGAFASGWLGLSLYRVVYAATPWGACGGSASWDQNDGVTYYSGTMTTSGSGVLTLTDGSKSWTTNQLSPAGSPYTVYDSTQGFWAEIVSNTATTITILAPISESGWTGFNNGDSYQILRAPLCIDAPGRGQGSYISGSTPTPTGWVSEASSPIYQWDDTTSGGSVNAPMNSNTGRVISNRDFYIQASGIQTSATAPFNGSSGTGWGTPANRPTTCTTGVGYAEYSGSNFVQLDKCASTNSWTNAAYTAYTYPHPLDLAVGGCNLASGATVSQIQTAINSAASNACPAPNTSTVFFAAGSYTISSLITVPCPTTAMTITGPVVPYVHPASLLPGSYSYASPYTAILNGTLTSSSGWQVNACSVPVTIQYFEWNGNQQNGGGGGWLDVAGGTSNLTVQYNYAHGNWASTSTPHNYDDLIDLEGVGFSQTPIDSNVRIIWNQFGNGASDCNPLMNLFTYQGDSYIRAGGYCGAVGVHVSTTNLVIQNNNFEHLEQPLKFFQGSSSAGDITHTFMLNNALIDSNDFGQVHRIGVEAQQAVVQNNSTGGVFTFSNNSFHDPISPDYGLFGASLPMCCSGYSGYSTSDNQVNCNNNSMGENVTPVSFIGGAFEWWSTGSCNNNLMQGWWGSYNNAASTGAIEYGFTSTTVRTWVASNNTCQFTLSGGVCVGNEGEQSTSSPIQSSNVTTTTIAPVTSFAPTISPAPGSKSYPLTVTLTDPGYTAGSVPQGNTGIWYTIDGTTPVPGAGSAKYLTTGQTFILSGPATVQAVGMWGALNQPTNYPSGGYGWAPSAVVSAVYTTSGAVTLSSVTIAATGGVATLSVGQTVQMIVICHYSDGSISGCNTTDSHGNAVTAWSSSNGNVVVSSSGLATAAAVGTATVTATVTGGVVTSPGFGLTVNAPPLTLSSITVAATGGVTSITAPATNQLITTCHYNDGTTTSCNAMDSHGNSVTTANSSAPSIATVTSPGSLVTGVAAGSTALTTTVTPTPSMLGTGLQDVGGSTNNGAMNEIYGVTGTSAGNYSPGDCHIIIPATTWAVGKHWDCILILGTPTTQNAAALCKNTYTTVGTSWPGGDLVIPMAGVCPALPPDQGYWLGSETDQAGTPAQGFSDCGNGSAGCTGAPPVFGSGQYPYRYIANPYGTYTSLGAPLSTSTPGLQVSQYLLLTTTPVTSNSLPLTVSAAAPTLLSAYITGASSLVVPNTAQMAAKCHYTSGPDQDCTVADIYGDKVSAWLTSDASKATVQNVGASSPGLVTAVAAGTPSITAVINNSFNSSAFPITITAPSVTLTGITLSTAGGITGLFQGNTNQLKATCSYSDGSNDDCTNTDAHGSKANTWTSTTPGHASINSTSGLVTGVAPGGTTFTAKAGTFTSPALPLTVLTIPSGVYTITIRGPIRFSGTVRF